MGFQAARWRRPENLASLHEWGLGGKSFGTITTWFLLGGDLYTAYTFIAVPAAMWATGAVVRLLRRAVHDRALPDHLLLPRPDVVGRAPARLRHHRRHRAGPVRHPQPEPGGRGHRHPGHDALHRPAAGRHPGRARGGRARRGERAGQGPAAADRLRRAGGVHLLLRSAGAGHDRLRQGHPDLPRDRGRGDLPAAEVRRLGRDLRRRRGQDGRARPRPTPRVPTGSFIPERRCSTGRTRRWRWARPWPCSCTRTASPRRCRSKDRSTGRRNAAILPAYSLLLGLLALLGYVAIKAGTQPIGLDGKVNPQLVIPQLFEDHFPGWFAGVAFGAIAIGALVPAAIMSIAAANLFTRNIYKAYLKPEATDAQEAKVSKIVSLITKLGRAAVRAHPGQAERAELPAARRGVDPADAAVDRLRAVHPLVPPLGAAGRLGRRHDLRHGRRLRLLHGLHHPALRQLAGRRARARARRLHRADRVRDQRAGRGDRADRGLPGAQARQRHRHHHGRPTTSPTSATPVSRPGSARRSPIH